MDRSKKYMYIGVIILLITLVSSIGTYAYFTWSSTDNTTVTLSIGDLADVTYTTGPDININNLSPVYNYTDGESTTFSIKNKDTSNSLIYSIKLDITTIDTELQTDTLKYILQKDNTTISEGDFKDITSNSSTILYSGALTSSTKSNYKLYIYIDGNYENNSNMMNKSLTGKIDVEVEESINVLTRLGLSVDTSHTPDFTTVSGNSGVKYENYTATEETTLGDNTNGIYISEDDLGTSYYFRGDVQNNYVYFANNWWRIIRINGDGTIRMIYTSNPNDSISLQYISKAAYNNYGQSIASSSDNSDNAHVGYMYGTAGSSTYEEAHSNTNNSNIKRVIDTWYQNNLSSYSKYIADAIYCNDREVATGITAYGSTFTGDGTGTNNTAYASVKRNHIEHNPSLKCTNKNDRFTVSSNLGNGHLTYPIGLVTTDEVVLSGGYAYDATSSFYIKNENYYLYSDATYWTMTPSRYYNKSNDSAASTVAFTPAFIFYVPSEGNTYVDYASTYIGILTINANISVRPVISLKSNAITNGEGTITNPFYVDTPYTTTN